MIILSHIMYCCLLLQIYQVQAHTCLLLSLSICPQSKQGSSYSDRDTTEDDSESLEDMDFLSRQKKLQAEAKLALAMAKPMAKMQVEVEKQNRKKSPVADLVRVLHS